LVDVNATNSFNEMRPSTTPLEKTMILTGSARLASGKASLSHEMQPRTVLLQFAKTGARRVGSGAFCCGRPS
jgi:hypothetical protein